VPEAFAGSVARLRFLAERIPARARALNIGVGYGVFEELAQRRGVEVWALDPSAPAIEGLRQRLGLGERAQVGYAQAIPFASDFFDAVVVSEVLEHLDDDLLHQTLDEIARVLAPAGRLLGTVPARERLADSRAVCPDCGKVFHRWGHVQSFDSARLRGLLERRFAVARIDERPFVAWTQLNWKGRLLGLAKKALAAVGTHGTGENLVFEATRRR
jgi:SAM-dependent methyltransferase